MYSRALKSWHVYGPLILRSIVDFLQTWIFVTNSSPIIWCYCDEFFELTIFQATNTCIWRINTYFEYTKFISKVRRNLWHQDDLILNPLQLLKLWLGVKVRVRVPFAWSCREDMLCWWPWPPSPFQYGDNDIHIQTGTTCGASSQRIRPRIIFS